MQMEKMLLTESEIISQYGFSCVKQMESWCHMTKTRASTSLYLCQELFLQLPAQFLLDLTGIVHGASVFVPVAQIVQVQFALHIVQLIFQLL
jgi:hypothetical protein